MIRLALALGLVLSLLACDRATLIVADDAGVGDASAEAAVTDAGPVAPIGGSECDQQGDCSACVQCVQAPRQSCVDRAVACSEDAACSTLVTCLDACDRTDDDCARRCAAASPGGRALVIAFFQCAYCDACTADCRAEQAWCQAPPF